MLSLKIVCAGAAGWLGEDKLETEGRTRRRRRAGVEAMIMVLWGGGFGVSRVNRSARSGVAATNRISVIVNGMAAVMNPTAGFRVNAR